MVCWCEDVTSQDIRDSIAEGFDSIELIKRYSTISMGPCQGKMCGINALRLVAQINGQSVAVDRDDDRSPASDAGDDGYAGRARDGAGARDAAARLA